jgi:hypothetical protein
MRRYVIVILLALAFIGICVLLFSRSPGRPNGPQPFQLAVAAVGFSVLVWIGIRNWPKTSN